MEGAGRAVRRNRELGNRVPSATMEDRAVMGGSVVRGTAVDSSLGGDREEHSWWRRGGGRWRGKDAFFPGEIGMSLAKRV
jgi:hypothetical protein